MGMPRSCWDAMYSAYITGDSTDMFVPAYAAYGAVACVPVVIDRGEPPRDRTPGDIGRPWERRECRVHGDTQ